MKSILGNLRGGPLGSLMREGFMGALALVCVVLAVLRVAPACSSLDREKIDATVLGFLLVPFAWVLARGAKILKVGTEGFEYEALERTVQETHAAVIQTQAAVENNAARIEETSSVLHATQLAVAHGVGGRQREEADAAPGLAAAESRLGMKTAPVDPRDPQKGRWGGLPQVNGRRLEADVIPMPDVSSWYRVIMRVVSTDTRKPLTESVRFHLHDTFSPPVVAVPVRSGSASLERLAYGAFTVGAEVDGGHTRLELDLAEVPGVPEEFRQS